MVTRPVLPFAIPLFVPADRPERFEKAAAAGADAVILDLEDAVAADAKDAARAALRSGFGSVPIIVRVNGLGTPWHAADMAALAGHGFAAVMVPKAEAGEPFSSLCGASPVPVVALVESARGLADARRIAETSNVTRLAFGSIDFCADIGCMHTRDALLVARSELVLASRLAGLVAPVDGVTTSIGDAGAISADARHALDLGFGGKLAIHPRQIVPIRAGLAPDEAEIAWARKVLASGDGAAAVDGAMVDEPVRIRARTILSRQMEPPPGGLIRQAKDDCHEDPGAR
ncbi:CoA ester lyase [Xanthobacter sp. KR7-65]|uniref:HpcH/HpaI aldolase/citrate lyase family protein n=1 Tax=Xanthobacter sp. KR7-65 TaxID=3156612 RepID=UPI0032B31DB5